MEFDENGKRIGARSIAAQEKIENEKIDEESKKKWRNTKPSWQNTISVNSERSSIKQINLKFSDVKHYSSQSEKECYDDDDECTIEFTHEWLDYLSGGYYGPSGTARKMRLRSFAKHNVWQTSYYLPKNHDFVSLSKISAIILKNKDADFSTLLAVSMYMRAKENNWPLLHADIIVPVPNFGSNVGHVRDTKAESIAKKLTRIINEERLDNDQIAYQSVLKKLDDVSTKKKSEEEKEKYFAENQVFELDYKYKSFVNEKNVILIDDVVTRGFSAERCMKELEKNGASKINFYATATTRSY